MNEKTRRCSARRNDGRPCQAWAVRDSEEALCATHLKRRRAAQEDRGLYEAAYNLDEMADRIFKAEDKDLKDELGLTRIAVRQALDQLNETLEPDEFRRLIALIYRGTLAIAGIKRAQRSLKNTGKDDLPQAFDEGLSLFSEERGLDL
jgi:hypothetical protein